MYFLCPSPACSAVGRVPAERQQDRPGRGVWTGHAHPVLLLPADPEHLLVHRRDWRDTRGSGALPAAGLGHYLPLHPPRSQVHGKGGADLCVSLVPGVGTRQCFSPGTQGKCLTDKWLMSVLESIWYLDICNFELWSETKLQLTPSQPTQTPE